MRNSTDASSISTVVPEAEKLARLRLRSRVTRPHVRRTTTRAAVRADMWDADAVLALACSAET